MAKIEKYVDQWAPHLTDLFLGSCPPIRSITDGIIAKPTLRTVTLGGGSQISGMDREEVGRCPKESASHDQCDRDR